MDKKTWTKIERILDDIIGLPESEQQHQIAKLCGEENSLQNQVLQMVSSIRNSETFLKNISQSKVKVRDSLLSKLENEKNGELFINRQLGRYRTIKQIGSGGMGSVFLAERCDGVFEKKVAIKILKKEFAHSDIKSNFKQEWQILANLNHQGIAKIYDAGIFEGLPYFVMEYVEGIPIDLYCDYNALSVDQRLQLFKTVCKTVQYAHNNLVIHRDLKPHNILVDKDGQLKILDFGIATLQNDQHANPSDIFLTAAYAAPEQLNNNKITTATDIYALGVLFYQLLSGCKPFDLTNKTIKEMIEIKLNITTPSLCFNKLPAIEKNEIARKRSTTPQKLSKILSGELDQIVTKSLSPNVDERYPSANNLKQDISNYEKQFPVHACNQTLIYRTNKFIKRNYKGLSLALIMICTIFGMLFFYFKNIEAERNIAITETIKAEEITDFMIGLFEMNDPAYNPGNHLTAKDLLYIGLEKTENLTDNELQAGILTVMGSALTNLSDFEKANEVLMNAVQKNQMIHGELNISTADAFYALGNNHSKNMMWEFALPNFEKAYEIYSKLLDPNHFKVVNSLSKLTIAMWNTGNEGVALKLSDQAYNMVRRRSYKFSRNA
jgi:eukaryotic-like serine/threonine-protein kinase